MIHIQKQTWTRVTIYLLATEGGSCQLEIYPSPRGRERVSAYICRLWVDEEHRRKGIAATLLDTAEKIARGENMDAVFLEWREADTPRWMYDYYRRRGYKDMGMNLEEDVLMKLKLEK